MIWSITQKLITAKNVPKGVGTGAFLWFGGIVSPIFPGNVVDAVDGKAEIAEIEHCAFTAVVAAKGEVIARVFR